MTNDRNLSVQQQDVFALVDLTRARVELVVAAVSGKAVVDRDIELESAAKLYPPLRQY